MGSEEVPLNFDDNICVSSVVSFSLSDSCFGITINDKHECD